MIFGRAAIKDANGNVTGYTVKSYGYYTYDAWGNVTAYTSTGGTPASTSLIYRNPLRYRGYIYDNETGFYYLQSRYYDPANHRFINADSLASTGQGFTGTNMFAYCSNNPVVASDPSGEKSFWGAVAGIVIAGVGIAGCLTGSVPPGFSAALIVSGGLIAYAAVTDGTVVLDASISANLLPDGYLKTGYSTVIDFNEDGSGGIYGYSHTGGGVGLNTGISFSVGLVDNFNNPDDYEQHFIDMNLGDTIGLDYCFDPTRKPPGKVGASATCVTFSIGVSCGVGYDYYSKATRIFEWE